MSRENLCIWHNRKHDIDCWRCGLNRRPDGVYDDENFFEPIENIKQTKLEEEKMKVADKQTEIVSESEWLVARKDLLTREKEFTRQRDALSAARRELPMVKIEKEYVFDGPDGKETLADLFEGRSQLIVYHFMFGPGWEEGRSEE